MTPEEKVGQLLMVGINGTTLSEETQSFLTAHYIGGVVLYSKNVATDIQVSILTQEIQTNNPIPLFISIDQEGGIVSRLKWNDTLTIAQKDITTSEQAYTVAKERGEILKKIGINMNLAPVVEYITDKNSFLYERVFRGTSEEIAQKGIASLQGYAKSGILAVLKHYPGHANLSPDSHYSLPEVDVSPEQWNAYVQPFSKIISEVNVDGIMVGHIMYPQIDNHPATLSKEIITNRLIGDLAYDGLIISDDMGMGALNNQGTIPEIAKHALDAGNDILIYTTADPVIQQQVYDYILQEVTNGNMNIDNKVLKILKEKLKYGIIPSNFAIH
jgi:beta-N-acetylhexosaminidase